MRKVKIRRLKGREGERLDRAVEAARDRLRLDWEEEWPRTASRCEELLEHLGSLEAEEFDVADLSTDSAFRRAVESALGALPKAWREGAYDRCRGCLSDPEGYETWDEAEIEDALADPDTCDACREDFEERLEGDEG